MGKKEVYHSVDALNTTITSKKVDTETGETISEGVGFRKEQADRNRRAKE